MSSIVTQEDETEETNPGVSQGGGVPEMPPGEAIERLTTWEYNICEGG